jgi:uncharacterized protein YukE
METKTVVMKQANIDHLIGIYKESRAALISKIKTDADLFSIGGDMKSMLSDIEKELSPLEKAMIDKSNKIFKGVEEKFAKRREKMIETLDQIDSVLEDFGITDLKPSKQSIIEMTEVVIK